MVEVEKPITDGVVSYKEVLVKDIYGAENPSKMRVIHRNAKQVLVRSAKRSGKIVLVILGVLPIAIFVHLLLAVEILAFLVAVGLFFWGLGDVVTFDQIRGVCPICKQERLMRPFSSSRFHLPIQIQDPECGNTFTAVDAQANS